MAILIVEHSLTAHLLNGSVYHAAVRQIVANHPVSPNPNDFVQVSPICITANV
jgi:hypothetical protein